MNLGFQVSLTVVITMHKWIKKEYDISFAKETTVAQSFNHTRCARSQVWLLMDSLPGLAQSVGAVNTTTVPLKSGKILPNECPRYDTKQSDGDAPVMLEIWGVWSTPLLPSLPGRLWPGVVARERFLSMVQMKFNRGFLSLLGFFLYLNSVFC